MTLVLIFGYLAFTAAMLFLMISPFLGGQQASVRAEHLDEEVRELEQLLARRQVLLSSLRELEFEHATGKSAKGDYETFKKRYEREAVMIMRRLDELHGGRGWESKIDAELEARLGKRSRHAEAREAEANASTPAEAPAATSAVEEPQPVDATPNGVDVEEAVQPADEPTDEPAASLACLGCGTELEPEDIFCSRCGTRVDSATASPADDSGDAKQGATP